MKKCVKCERALHWSCFMNGHIVHAENYCDNCTAESHTSLFSTSNFTNDSASVASERRTETPVPLRCFFLLFFFVFLNLAQKTTRPSWRHRSHLTLQLGPVCTNVNDTLWSLAGDDIYLFDGAICDIFTALCQSMSSINICSVKTKNNCFDVTNRKKDPRLHTRRNNNIDQQEAGPLNVHNPRKELCDFLTRVEKSMHELNSLFNNSRSSNSSVPPQHFHGIFKV